MLDSTVSFLEIALYMEDYFFMDTPVTSSWLMKIMPWSVNALKIELMVLYGCFSREILFSRRAIVGFERSLHLASSSWLQPKRARAALICFGPTSLFILNLHSSSNDTKIIFIDNFGIIL